jgi:hypothetical protein
MQFWDSRFASKLLEQQLPSWISSSSSSGSTDTTRTCNKNHGNDGTINHLSRLALLWMRCCWYRLAVQETDVGT